MFTTSHSRRGFLRRFMAGAAALAFARTPQAFAADAPPHLSTSDPTAKSLGYTEDASKLDPAKEPVFKPGSKCSTCTQYQAAQASGGYAPCTIFPGKVVNANGWCKAFIAKT